MIRPDTKSLAQGKPAKWGNCFDLIDESGKYHRVVNFNVENFNAIVKKLNLEEINVEFIPKSSHLWEIKDDRIPQEWYSEAYCTVCTPMRMLPFEQRKEYLKTYEFKKIVDKTGSSYLRVKLI